MLTALGIGVQVREFVYPPLFLVPLLQTAQQSLYNGFLTHWLSTISQTSREMMTGAGWGIMQQMFIRGGSAPDSSAIAAIQLFIYHFSRKRYPFRIPSIDK